MTSIGSRENRTAETTEVEKKKADIKNGKHPVRDLRSTPGLLEAIPGQYVETDVEVNPRAELPGVYYHIGAGGTAMRPTKEGPTIVFHKVKGHPDTRVAIGVLASKTRVVALLDCEPQNLGKRFWECASSPIQPMLIGGDTLCQEAMHRSDEPRFDLAKLASASTSTPDDAGPYITLRMCYTSHPDIGASDVTIHKPCIQGKSELSIFFTPGARYIGTMTERAEGLSRSLPVSISIEVDPATEIGFCLELPTIPPDYDELPAAGALRGEPVELCRCLTVDQRATAGAEYIIREEACPGIKVQEDRNSHTRYAVPEFPGYTKPASGRCWIIKIKTVTRRLHPVVQTCIGPSEERVSMAGILTKASICEMVEKVMPGRLQNIYCPSAGGGKYMAVLQFEKKTEGDEGCQRQAALLTFSAFSELKRVFLVDGDANCFDMSDVLWAMNMRFQGDTDIIVTPEVRYYPLDLSNSPEYGVSIQGKGIAYKMIFDYTVPFGLKETSKWARFMEVDPDIWLKN